MISKLGIIGGGQLALMLIQSASKLGLEVTCLDPQADCPASLYASKMIVAEFNDLEALNQLVNWSDTVIYEFENVDLKCLKQVDQAKLFQGTEILKLSQNRIREKDFAQQIGLKTPKYQPVNSQNDLLSAIETIGYPGILKTCEMGYDGKGQMKIKAHTQLEDCVAMLNQELIYEQMIDFDYEISVIVVRGLDGSISTFKPFSNQHIDGILHHTNCDDEQITEHVKKTAQNLAEKFVTEIDYHGILCIEFFVKDEIIYFNEMAPRPHNSGHITSDAYHFSQFDLAINALCQYKLASPKLLSNMHMFNVLGQHLQAAEEFCRNNPQAKLYLYGKKLCKNNRKMGHINILDDKELIKKITKEVFNYE